VVLLFDGFWIWLIWKNWWLANLENGIIWRKLQRLHSVGIILNFIGIFLKLVTIFSLLRSEGKEMVGE
jgi:glucuronate isomerase